MLNELNFSFGGRHCLRDFGLIYVPDDSFPLSPAAERNVYEIAGHSGTVLLPGRVYGERPMEGTLYFVEESGSRREMMRRLERVTSWLLDGRQRLVFDWDPARYYVAEVADEMRLELGEWIEEGIRVTFTLQPYCFACRESEKKKDAAAAGAHMLPFAVDSGMAVPVSCDIAVRSGTLTAVTLASGSARATFDAMAIDAGDGLLIDMDAPVGARYLSGGSTLLHAARFDVVMASPGGNDITVTLAFAGEGAADIRLRARGRWFL